jgi:23S rRNA (uracil1939-C5)-methyltransferase
MVSRRMLCPHRPPCPGCPRLGRGGIPDAAARALATVAHAAGLPRPVGLEGAAAGFRHRARLAVRGRAASPKVGIFQEGSHRIVDIPGCLVHHPLVNEVAAAVKRAVRHTGVAPYADGPRRGRLRYLQVVVERATGRAQVVLVANDDSPDSLATLAGALAADLGGRLHSLWWNGNTSPGNAILGSRWHRWSGPEAVCETLGGARAFYPPGAFGQANLDLAGRLIAVVHGWVPDGSRVLELHAGVGAIGLGLVGRARHVAFNEASAAGLAGLALGLDVLAPGDRARTTVLPGMAAEHLDRLAEADVVICDPPRRGLEAALLARLAAAPPARLALVSCNLDAFLREARTLLDAGRTRLAAVVPVALFPWTDHVETVALFVRAPACRL